MSNNYRTADDGDEHEDEEQTIEFNADIVFRALELKRLIEESDVGLSETQRNEVEHLLDSREHDPGYGLTEDDVRRLIGEHSHPGDDDRLTEDDVRRIIREEKNSDGEGGSGGEGDSADGIDPDRISEIETELQLLRQSRENFERKVGLRGESWRVGPDEISSRASMHSTPLWGIHFKTERSLTLGDVTIRSLEPGTVTFRAYQWSGERGTLGDVLDEKEVRCSAEEQTVHLDFDIPENTSVLLTRPYPEPRSDAPSAYSSLPDQAFKPSDDETSLTMEEYDGWADDSKHGVTFHGKGHPIFSGNSVPYWYYFYSLEVITDASGG